MLIGTPCSGPEALAFLQRGVGGPGALARAVLVHPDDGVERRIVFLDAREEVVEQLEAADILAPDQRASWVADL